VLPHSWLRCRARWHHRNGNLPIHFHDSLLLHTPEVVNEVSNVLKDHDGHLIAARTVLSTVLAVEQHRLSTLRMTSRRRIRVPRVAGLISCALRDTSDRVVS